jgi:chromate transporter
MKNDLHTVFFSFFQIGLLSFGGGMAAMPLIQTQVVSYHKWLSLEEFTDLVTITEMTPGPIAVNASTFVGIRMGGFSGALAATAGCILPSCIIVFFLSKLYFRYGNLSIVQGILSGLRPAIVALIASAGVSIFCLAVFGSDGFAQSLSDVNIIGILLFAEAFVLLRKWHWNPIGIMLFCGLAGGVLYGCLG